MSEEILEINHYLNETLAGVPEDISSVVIDALAVLSDELAQSVGLNAHLSYAEKIDSIRYAYTSLVNYLVEHNLNHLNPSQRVFLNTGAIADLITFEDEQGRQFGLQLLDPELYRSLRAAILDFKSDTLPPWSHTIYRCEDQFNAIALGVLEPEGLDKKSLAKFRATRSLDTQIAMSREQTTILNNTYYAMVGQNKELFRKLENLVAEFKYSASQIAQIDELLNKAKHYSHVIAMREIPFEERDEISQIMRDPSYRRLGQDLEVYAEHVVRVMDQVRENSLEIDIQSKKLKEITGKLIKAGTQDIGSVRDRDDLIFDEETIRLIKNNIANTGNYAVAGARKSPFKIPESTSRILLDVHSKHCPEPLSDCYATLQNATAAFEKILSIHVNLFEKDEAGSPILPPVLIEPIRNYVEWTGERFVVGFVSGEVPRQGVQVSFSSLEMSILRACGMYAFRDKIFDYRGNRLEGNLMADYSARLESQTAVKWVGEEKKYKLVTVLQEVDSAGRNEAVNDYMEFVFHAANHFPAPLGISKRKLATMLKYIQIGDLNRTIALLLRYVADKEPEEAKDSLLWHAGHDRQRARRLIASACENYQEMLTETEAQYTQKILGSLL
ncbi:hypothetical protein COW36_00960 [bacterium (Candidatus Blackallbacteria) CG17_big_fil_post_rev_8_21_14_2_50_48_46]|uniref:Uncharacterized protein n=1 Tax=bacterium (Candidatus Blackallbacteria) CG17_big_fil_post_rev_8_21_14_2_50_48_46 TaxID=2014261 RepID=A0A2M7GB93_9BACT|nr:MAG: hypothetical protein COW64_10215 [bacterium (Candidatus Blackallbacteria) CG18_big_fil_WC_8_21_14_2_50_49_26]PIW19438.1 MAG: hypothetical protein COW36_00960 [bacterium (Candidatus Blackallbacteria) CG17_big_fil_post_rev_8_21_14_2_50_48_46]PIW48958.1 MAG: hypothetical protein COW20_07495 [bacterium (Candidatus Blackallbacteria) CG13_big_fil_rev_8_21_14_2_50_49_14]